MKNTIFIILSIIFSIISASCGYVNKDVPNEQMEALKQEVIELDRRCESLKAEKLSLETAISKKDAMIKDYYNQTEEAARNCR